MKRITSMITILTALTAAACGGSSSTYGGISSPPPPTDPRTVTATSSLAFEPATVTVSAGDTVTFNFQTVAHNVFFDPQNGVPTDIDGSNANTSVRRVFTTAGTYRYTCHIHPFMVGTVAVQ